MGLQRIPSLRLCWSEAEPIMSVCLALLHQIEHEADPRRPTVPFWNNIWFTALDAATLWNFRTVTTQAGPIAV
jgi:hypothetical protein